MKTYFDQMILDLKAHYLYGHSSQVPSRPQLAVNIFIYNYDMNMHFADQKKSSVN